MESWKALLTSRTLAAFAAHPENARCGQGYRFRGQHTIQGSISVHRNDRYRQDRTCEITFLNFARPSSDDDGRAHPSSENRLKLHVARRLKELNPKISRISLQPDSPLHGIEGTKHVETSIIPKIYDASIANEELDNETGAAHRMARRLAREEGLLIGVS
jgi:hypothetical protein